MIWLCWVLWHINHFWLFNDESCFCIYLNIYVLLTHFVDTFLNGPIVEWFQVFLSIHEYFYLLLII